MFQRIAEGHGPSDISPDSSGLKDHGGLGSRVPHDVGGLRARHIQRGHTLKCDGTMAERSVLLAFGIFNRQRYRLCRTIGPHNNP
jgi:hypothetical protein